MRSLAATPDIVTQGKAALPDCFGYELDRCLNFDNEGGLPPGQCAAIVAAYDSSPENEKRMDDFVNSLRICKPPSPIPYAGIGFLAGAAVAFFMLR